MILPFIDPPASFKHRKAGNKKSIKEKDRELRKLNDHRRMEKRRGEKKRKQKRRQDY